MSTPRRHVAPNTRLCAEPHRPFATSPPLLKKGAKAARSEKQQASSSSSAKDTAATSDDPSDFSALEADIASAVERLKDDLSKLRAGGRFNPEVLENLRVQPDKSAAGGNATVKLSDVAQVIPKGPVVHILVGEKDVRVHQPCVHENHDSREEPSQD